MEPKDWQLVEKLGFSMNHFAKDKGDKEELFDRISTSSLNDYLKSFMPGLSAKVFRTFNASITLETELGRLNITKTTDLEDKVGMYNDANRQVAILCNHQKSVSKNFNAQMEKRQEKLKEKIDVLTVLKDQLKVLQGKKKSLKKKPAMVLPKTVDSCNRKID